MNTIYHRAKDPMRLLDADDKYFTEARKLGERLCIEIWTRDERQRARDE